MYKKITQNTIEEHFDNYPRASLAGVDIRSTIVDNTLSNILRRQSRDVMGHYVGRLRDTLIAICNVTGDATLGATLTTTAANELASIYGRYFSIGDTNIFTTQLGIITSTTIEMMQAIKAETSITALEAQNNAAIATFAELLVDTMNIGWTESDIIAVFTLLNSYWLDMTRARIALNWSEDFRLIRLVESMIVSGSPVATAFSDTFASAIIMTYPAQF